MPAFWIVSKERICDAQRSYVTLAMSHLKSVPTNAILELRRLGRADPVRQRSSWLCSCVFGSRWVFRGAGIRSEYCPFGMLYHRGCHLLASLSACRTRHDLYGRDVLHVRLSGGDWRAGLGGWKTSPVGDWNSTGDLDALQYDHCRACVLSDCRRNAVRSTAI